MDRNKTNLLYELSKAERIVQNYTLCYLQCKVNILWEEQNFLSERFNKVKEDEQSSQIDIHWQTRALALKFSHVVGTCIDYQGRVDLFLRIAVNAYSTFQCVWMRHCTSVFYLFTVVGLQVFLENWNRMRKIALRGQLTILRWTLQPTLVKIGLLNLFIAEEMRMS